MILMRILKRDLLRSWGTMVLVFAFVMLSSLLMSAGAGLIVALDGALDNLFEAARVPDVVQMHAGDIDRTHLERWAASHPMVEAYQTNEMITVEGKMLFLGDHEISEEESVMDISFVTQNNSFDLLLDGSNLPFRPAPSTIGVPIYFAQRDNLEIGDPVTLRTAELEIEFTIGAFIRDAQMNPSIVHSKRFVVHENDYAALRQAIPDIEYLISFRLVDPEHAEEFIAEYQAAGLPQLGPTVDKNLFRTLNALSDGIAAAVVILLSGVLMVIAILCLRFTVLASLEEEYREIGVMKAIGMPAKQIRRIYLVKYVAVGLTASAIGYAVSLPLTAFLSKDVAVYLGRPETEMLGRIIPAAAAGIVCVAVVVSCLIILRRFKRISAVEALRSQKADLRDDCIGAPRLSSWKGFEVNVALGLRDVTQRLRLYGLLGSVFFFAAFLITVPVHFYTTMTAPSFVSYMGIGRSDVRIDLRQSENSDERYDALNAELATDPDVARYASLVTSKFTLLRENGEQETIALETGDIGRFALDYVQGESPHSAREIAFSYLNGREMDLEPGDRVTVILDGLPQELTVSGIYQDVTNGGRTAKARLPYNREGVLWYSFAVDLEPGVAVAEKTREYATRFAPARVTDLVGYMEQTLGNTISRLRVVMVVAILVGLGVSVLVTALFMQMLIRKDAPRISAMRSIGFSLRHVRRQYQTTLLAVLAGGLALGTLFSNTLGERLVSVLWSFMGAARIHFVISPVTAYLILPLLFAGVVAATTRTTLSGEMK